MRLLRTWPDRAALVARLTLGVVMFPHGAQKTLGWFGGEGARVTLATMAQEGIPAAVTLLVMVAELAGSIALVLGLAGRLAAAGIAVTMLGAIALVHIPNGFFMNWTGQQAGEGFEYHLLALGLAIVVIIRGSGVLSVDRALTRRAAADVSVARGAWLPIDAAGDDRPAGTSVPPARHRV